MVLELPIDVENPYRLYRKGYIDIATSWPIFSNLPLYIEIYRVGDNIIANTLFLNTMAGNNSSTDIDVSLLK